MKSTLKLWMLMSLVMLGLASCTDAIDNTVSGGDEPEQSAVDTKGSQYDKNGDRGRLCIADLVRERR